MIAETTALTFLKTSTEILSKGMSASWFQMIIKASPTLIVLCRLRLKALSRPNLAEAVTSRH
jgi:hypothetical protein